MDFDEDFSIAGHGLFNVTVRKVIGGCPVVDYCFHSNLLCEYSWLFDNMGLSLEYGTARQANADNV